MFGPLLLTFLPLALFIGVLVLPLAPPPPVGEARPRGGVLPAAAFIALLPLGLLVRGSDLRLALTAAAALYGGLLLGRWIGLAIVAVALTAWSAFAPVALFDLIAVMVAVAGGFLAYRLFGRGRLLPFLGVLVVADVIVTSSGLLAAAAAPLVSGPPAFIGVVVDGRFLGGIDLACAVLVALELKRRLLGHGALIRAAVILLAVQALVVVAAELSGRAIPATLPAFVALLSVARVSTSSAGPDANPVLP